MTRFQTLIVYVLLIFLSPTECLRCHRCMHNTGMYTMFELPCSTLSQVHCASITDNCFILIHNNSATKGCVNAIDGTGKAILERCEETKEYSPLNCKICTKNLCNAGRTCGGAAIWFLLLLKLI